MNTMLTDRVLDKILWQVNITLKKDEREIIMA